MSQVEPIYAYDTNGNLIYYKNSTGFEHWWERDSNDRQIHYRDSDGYEAWWEYDSNGKFIHYRDSNGDEDWYWEGIRTEDPIQILLIQKQIRYRASVIL